jgi:hypothetical protein
MDTMIPAIVRGRTERFADVLPDAEFHERVAALQAAMADRGVAALVVFGDRRDYAAVCYLSGATPREGMSGVIVPADGAPELFVGAPSARDLPGLRDSTWIERVGLFGDLWGRLDDRVGHGLGPIGFVLQSRAPSSLHRRVAAISPCLPMGELLTVAMRELRPRERLVLRDVVALASRAGRVAAAAFLSGATPREALIEAELLARQEGARDVRSLIGTDGGRTLSPAFAVGGEPPTSFVYYLAVERLGYWADQFGTVGPDSERGADSRASLARAVDGLRLGGVPVGIEAAHPVLAGRSFARLGLARDEFDEVPLGDGVYSLRHGALGADGAVLLSTTIDVDDGEVEVLA